MRTLLAAGLLGITVLVGCVGVVDGTGDDDGTTNPNPNPDPNPNPNPNPDPNPQPTPALTATIDKATIASSLGATETLTVSLTGSGGFSGAVTLTPTAVDAGGAAVTGWTFTMTPPTVNLAADGTASVAIAVVVPTDSASLMANISVAVAATGVTVAPLTSAFTVANTYTVHIKAGTGTGSHADSFPKLLKLKTGATLVFVNDDTVVHRIHADGGFAHEPNDLQPGAKYTQVPTGDATFYCHDHDDGSKNNLALE